jgi:hypothetical protein
MGLIEVTWSRLLVIRGPEHIGVRGVPGKGGLVLRAEVKIAWLPECFAASLQREATGWPGARWPCNALVSAPARRSANVCPLQLLAGASAGIVIV